MAAIEGKWYASVGSHARDAYPEDDDTVRFVYAAQPDGEKYVVAKVWAGDDGDFESTARLVAAAPELLAALKLCREAMLNLYHNSNEIPEESPEFDEGGACHNALGAALRVINKTEGRGE
jgi:hypothetical protein